MTENRGPGRELVGLIIILVGFGLLMNTMNIFPAFPFLWIIQRFWLPAMFMGIGALLLSRRGQDGKGGGLVFFFLGFVFLMGSMDMWDFSYRRWIGPGILIWIGIVFLMKSQRPRMDRKRDEGGRRFGSPPFGNAEDRFEKRDFGPSQFTDSSDLIHATVILGAFNRRCPSQHFRGGDLTAIMGGGKLDLREANLQDNQAVLDIFSLMGGIEIQVPPGWVVEPRFTPILGGYSDRTNRENQSGSQRLIINGTAIMGGITVLN